LETSFIVLVQLGKRQVALSHDGSKKKQNSVFLAKLLPLGTYKALKPKLRELQVSALEF
jgi:hypothetical protein